MPIMQPIELRKVRHHNRAALEKFPKVNSGIVKCFGDHDNMHCHAIVWQVTLSET